ncbi:hypothetical protein MTR67_034959 [Solanum verrucosum]|uniref:Reverse transcriptase zinc-binding domain-containing protein n=1 Tax=Solanum verrucosum TaxID=315347 RepID=A0AAF0U9B4_SOLVR|nr:hypothetical protein MTR67_034959 [Solanum verrucosum]
MNFWFPDDGMVDLTGILQVIDLLTLEISSSFFPKPRAAFGRKLEDTYKAFTSKQWWKFRTSNSLWVNFLKAKYCINDHPTTIQWKPGQSHSWKAMLKIRSEVDGKIWWTVRERNVDFWFDNLTKEGPLWSLMEDVIVDQHISITEVYRQSQWDWNVLHPYPSEKIKDLIRKCFISLNNNTKDIPYWTEMESGTFSISSAWNLLMQKRLFAPIDSKLWHKNVPYKMSCVAWRAIHCRMPTDDKVAKKFKINFVSKCFCCIGAGMKAGMETAEHLFCSGHFAQLLWSSFLGRIGICTKNTSLRDLIQRCWNCTAKNPIAAYVVKILPPILMWELWRSRCNSSYDEEKPSIIRSTSLISFNICQLSKKTFTNLNIPENWENLLKLMELSIVYTSSVPVRWLKPPFLFVKMNSDDSCVGNST